MGEGSPGCLREKRVAYVLIIDRVRASKGRGYIHPWTLARPNPRPQARWSMKTEVLPQRVHHLKFLSKVGWV